MRVMTRQIQPTGAEQQPCHHPQTGPEVHLQSLRCFSAGPGPQAPLGNPREALTSPCTQTPLVISTPAPVAILSLPLHSGPQLARFSSAPLLTPLHLAWLLTLLLH